MNDKHSYIRKLGCKMPKTLINVPARRLVVTMLAGSQELKKDIVGS